MKHTGPPIVKVACGADFSLILDCKGVLYSFGSPEYGQLGKSFEQVVVEDCIIFPKLEFHIFLGHGTTGEYIAQANKVSYNIEKVPKRICLYVEKGRDQRPVPVDFPEIIDISCGTNHSVGVFSPSPSSEYSN